MSGEGVAVEEAGVRLSDVWRLPGSLWLMSGICVAYYNAVFPLVGFGLLFYESKYRLGVAAADSVNSLIYLISIIASPAWYASPASCSLAW